MFFNNAKRFEKREEVTRPYSDAINLFDYDRMGSRNNAIKIVDSWRKSPSPSNSDREGSPSPSQRIDGLQLQIPDSSRDRPNTKSPLNLTVESISVSSKMSFASHSRSEDRVTERLTFISPDTPGPGFYQNPRSTLVARGSLPFAPPVTVEKRAKPKAQTEITDIGPGSYYHPTNMILPSFNAQVNETVKSKSKKKENEVEMEQKKPFIVSQVEAAVAVGSRSANEERQQLRKNLKSLLQSLK